MSERTITVETDNETYVDVRINGNEAVSVDISSRRDSIAVTLYDQDDPELTDRIDMDWEVE